MLTPERRKEIADEAAAQRKVLGKNASMLMDAEAELTRLEERVRELEQALRWREKACDDSVAVPEKEKR